jgi:Tol biopolymer transport system component
MVPIPVDYYGHPEYTTGAFSSDSPEITPDGRYVAFITTFNFSPISPVYGDSGTSQGIFVSDLVAGTTTLVSSNIFIANCCFPSNPSYNHAISDNGRFVAFESRTNYSGGGGVIQRYNLQTGFTDIVCTNAIPLQTSPFFRDLDMTPDGRFIAFVVNSNFNYGSLSYPNYYPVSSVCVWDAQTATTTLVSCNTNNALPTNTVSCQPVVDPGGRFVVFLSTATSLTTNAVAGGFHLYLRDLLASTTTLLDADTNGFGFPKDFMNPARLTPDGRFLAFDCTDGNLVTNDNNRAFDVFLRELTTNTTELISVRQPALPSQTPGGFGAAPIFSVDTVGRFIAFASAANSLVPNYTNLYRGVFVHDFLSGTNILVSADTNGLDNAGGMSSDPSISGDGRYVVFTSSASNLTPGDNKSTTATAAQDVFLRDLQTGITTLISTNATGPGPGNGDSYSPIISADGRYVLFRSKANNLAANGPSRTGNENLYLRDLQAGITYTLTTGGISFAAMSPDGHFVVFGGTPLYVWDSQAATTVYSVNTTAINAAISPDGNRIVYSTSAGFYAVDRAANTNWMIGPPLSGSHAGLQFSGDARFLVYSTTNAQVAPDTNNIADVYLYDFVTSSNFLVSQGNPPGGASGPSDSPVISNDGRFIAYRSTATNILPGATNGLPNVFLYDRQTGITTLLSTNASGTAGNNRSFAPQFSGDGQTVVFQSWASDLIAHDINQVNDLFALKIAMSPNIVSPLTNQTVPVGGTAAFSITVSGTAPFSYQWSFNGTNISGATNASLTLTNVQFSQAGNYAICVTNAYGSALSSNALLLVPPDHFAWNSIPSPRFVNTPFAITIRAQDPANSILTNFTGIAILGTTNDIAVTPSVSGNFAQGVWTGAVMISQTASNLVLQAEDGLGHSGLANPINVINTPSLGMLHSGNVALFLWPVGYSGFVLEASGNLSPAKWVAVPYAPFQIGDQYLLPLDMTGTNGFYRLRFPGP